MVSGKRKEYQTHKPKKNNWKQPIRRIRPELKGIWYIWNMDHGYVDINRMLYVRNAYVSIVFLLSCGRIESPDLLESNAARFSFNCFFFFILSLPLFHYDALVVCYRRNENPSGTCRSISTKFFFQCTEHISGFAAHRAHNTVDTFEAIFCVCSCCYSRIHTQFPIEFFLLWQTINPVRLLGHSAKYINTFCLHLFFQSFCSHSFVSVFVSTTTYWRMVWIWTVDELIEAEFLYGIASMNGELIENCFYIYSPEFILSSAFQLLSKAETVSNECKIWTNIITITESKLSP